MADQMLVDAYDKLADLAIRAGKEEKYHDALQYAIAAYEITRETERDGLNLITLALIHEACGELIALNTIEVSKRRHESKFACSFCGKSNPEVKLAPGPGVYICNECVDTFAEGFKQKK
jgi:hypothetical protein